MRFPQQLVDLPDCQENWEFLQTLDGPWRIVGNTGEPAFQNSWVNYGGGLSTVAFYKGWGRIWLKGQVKNGTAGAVIFTLPTGFRPPERMDFPLANQNPAGADTFAILTDGTVNPVASQGNARVSLDGISFRLT